jgi:hypothetical protein
VGAGTRTARLRLPHPSSSSLSSRPAFALYDHVRGGWSRTSVSASASEITAGSIENRFETGWEEGTPPASGSATCSASGSCWATSSSSGWTSRVTAQPQSGSALDLWRRAHLLPGRSQARDGESISARGRVRQRTPRGLARCHRRCGLDPHREGRRRGWDELHGGQRLPSSGRQARRREHHITANYHQVGKEFFDKAWFIPVTLGLKWYF